MAENYEEKIHDSSGSQSPDHGVRDIVDQKGAAFGEAADIYGNVQTAQEFGYVERGYVHVLSKCDTLAQPAAVSSLDTFSSSP